MFNEAICDHSRETILRARRNVNDKGSRKGVGSGIGGIPPKAKKLLQKMVLFMKALFVIPYFPK